MIQLNHSGVKHQKFPVKTVDPVPEVEPDRPTILQKKTKYYNLSKNKFQKS